MKEVLEIGLFRQSHCSQYQWEQNDTQGYHNTLTCFFPFFGNTEELNIQAFWQKRRFINVHVNPLTLIPMKNQDSYNMSVWTCKLGKHRKYPTDES